MVLYSVYRAEFKTTKGRTRQYVGYTANLERRLAGLGRPGRFQPAWCKAGFVDGRVVVLAGDIRAKAIALGIEALAAAKTMEEAPASARGGPWVLPTLSAQDRREIKAVARCTNLQDMAAVAKQLGVGSLVDHLGDRKFQSAAAKEAEPVIAKFLANMPQVDSKPPRRSSSSPRLPVKRRSGKSGKSGRSGVSGHQYRRQAGIDYGSDRYNVHKYGKDPKCTRNKAQAKYRATGG